MTKRYYSKRYTRKRHTKYFVVGLILAFIMLVLVSAYSDIPQLEPIRKQIESFKSETGGFGLSIGDAGVVDGIAVTLVKGELNDGYTWFSWGSPSKVEPPEGAKFLFLYIKVENVGKIEKKFPCIYGCLEDEIPLFYANTKMPQHSLLAAERFTEYKPVYYGGSGYPGSSEEGWVAFEVPAGIELDKITFKIKDLVWNLEEEKIEKIGTIPLIKRH